MALNNFAAAAEPPAAKKIPYKLELHGQVRVDDYYWLKDRKDPRVLAYLKAENAYAEAALRHTEPLQEKLFTEMKGRVKQDDSTVPFRYGGYYYYMTYTAGKEYPVYARRKGSLAAQEEVLLDVNALAKGKAFCQVNFPSIRPDHKMIAYAVDTGGRRFFDVYFKDLVTGKLYADKIEKTAGDLEWANDNRTLFYVKQDPETLRWERVFAHELGRLKDAEIYFEADEAFEVGISKSATEKYLFIRSGSTLSTEYRLIAADRPSAAPVIFQPRQPRLEYEVEDGGEKFYVLNNAGARNFKVSVCSPSATGLKAWTDLVPHREDTLVEYIGVLENWLVIKERADAQGSFHIYDRASGKESWIKFDEPAYMTEVGDNFEYKTDTLRVTYESLTTPDSVYDVDLNTGGRKLMKRQEVLGGFKPGDYQAERLWFAARDGEMVPVSLVYKKSIDLESGQNPVHVYSYGSYGYSSDPYFSSTRLSLLDRGFICAIPHIRGGSELGRRWYEDGKLLKKKNTFYDFIDATRYLVDRGYTSPGHIYAEGGSAGGLLVGAVANLAPVGLYKGIIADVPFVDVVTTMLDPDIPLTTGEYDEWGDPKVKEAYDYMLSYSPYDNVERKPYPNLLITTGLNDSQVQYWEPAKWAAKLRAMKTDKNLVLLKTDMDTGHGGKSGRFEAMKLSALEYAFMLDLEGIKK
ncbi:MAG: oligopeptidase B [Elusimicrobia bacterium GWA2_61_42]|nr:MAG: oligopeptidase B [Elusimicrobia bacterium GWA2_61_42]OGR76227.1 MAG: oligopeptidase B [Elusimicrobia bacterium GWC2_61_25]